MIECVVASDFENYDEHVVMWLIDALGWKQRSDLEAATPDDSAQIPSAS